MLTRFLNAARKPSPMATFAGLLWLILPGLQTVHAQAGGAATPLPTGTFITEKSWGTLEIRQDGAKTLFSLSAFGGNAHTCELEGEIRGRVADLTEPGEKEGCKVTFTPQADRVSVKGSANGLCRNFCGVRADFEGDYHRAPQQCLADNVDKSRAQFRKLYDRKQHAEARQLHESTLKACGRFIGPVTQAWLRNDLAVALHKLGERKACLDALAPLAGDAERKDSALRESLPPTDAENYLPAVRAARHNLKLCRQLAP